VPKALAVAQRTRVPVVDAPVTEAQQWAEAFAAGETVTAYEDASMPNSAAVNQMPNLYELGQLNE
jgi:hypothetical protein